MTGKGFRVSDRQYCTDAQTPNERMEWTVSCEWWQRTIHDKRHKGAWKLAMSPSVTFNIAKMINDIMTGICTEEKSDRSKTRQKHMIHMWFTDDTTMINQRLTVSVQSLQVQNLKRSQRTTCKKNDKCFFWKILEWPWGMTNDKKWQSQSVSKR